MLDVAAQLAALTAVIVLGCGLVALATLAAATLVILRGLLDVVGHRRPGGWWWYYVGAYVSRLSVAADPRIRIRWFCLRPVTIELRARGRTHIIGLGPLFGPWGGC